MNLKGNKGYVGVDISIAVIILLIAVPTIMGIVYNINSSRNAADIKAGALNIAVNALEAAKGLDISNLNEETLLTDLSTNMYNGQMTKNPGNTSAVVTTDKASYQLEVNVTDYKETQTDATANIIKTVKATVIYKVRGNSQAIDLSTVVK